mgnify:CR=1 FL=1
MTVLMNKESIIRFYLNLFLGIPDQNYCDPTQIQINFSHDNENENEPCFLQGGYDFEMKTYWIIYHPLNNHFTHDAKYCYNSTEFFNNFIKKYKNIIVSGEKSIEILICENGIVIMRQNFL